MTAEQKPCPVCLRTLAEAGPHMHGDAEIRQLSAPLTDEDLEATQGHAPAPWRWVGWNYGGEAFWDKDSMEGRLLGADGEPVLDATSTEGEYGRVEARDAASARLIALAPRLVAEVRRLRAPIADADVEFVRSALRDWTDTGPEEEALAALGRIVAEVRRLRGIAGCRGCLAGYRLGADHLHYDDEGGGATWGVCERWAAGVVRDERNRLRRDDWIEAAALEIAAIRLPDVPAELRNSELRARILPIIRKHRDGRA